MVSTSSIAKLNIWYMLWYRRIPAALTRPWSRSMRMYGRENIAVVIATKAVSATRNTLSESTKNCSFRSVSGPSAMMRADQPGGGKRG